MKRTNVLELKPTKKQKQILDTLCLRSASVYNLANFKKRQVFIHNNQTGEKHKLPTAADLQKDLKTHKDYKLLGAGNSQQIINKLEEAWKSYHKSVKSDKVNHKVSLPKYSKNRKTNTTISFVLRVRNDLYTLNREYLYISCPKDLKEKYNVKLKLKIKTKGFLKWKGKQGHIEIYYDPVKKSYYVSQSISDVTKKGHIDKATKKAVYEDVRKVKKSEEVSSIDLGIKRLMTSLINDRCYAFDIQNQFLKYEKMSEEIIRLQSILDTEWQDEKGKPRLKSSKRIRKLFQKQYLRLDHLQNCVVKMLFGYYLENHVNTIVIGDIKNIRDTYKKNKYNNKLNKMINNFWSFGKLMHKLECKAEEHGIELIKVFEGYTSSTCPIDKSHRVVVIDREFRCLDCDYEHDRDAVGCINILKNHKNDAVETRPQLSIIQIGSESPDFSHGE